MIPPDHLERATAPEILGWAIEQFGRRFAVVTSFQSEGMVIVDMAARLSRAVRVITLDTGRLPAETHQMIGAVATRYGIGIEVVEPDPFEVERMVTRHGHDLFHREVALRKLCCHVRKVRPLERVTAGLDAWAAGLRREQSDTRAGVARIEIAAGKLKLNPLADWTARQVEEYIQTHDVPRHPLYAQGYRSIGCAPCTRATLEGEDERAGRWWWEQNADKECGLHFTAEGATVRQLDILIEEVVAARNA